MEKHQKRKLKKQKPDIKNISVSDLDESDLFLYNLLSDKKSRTSFIYTSLKSGWDESYLIDMFNSLGFNYDMTKPKKNKALVPYSLK